MEGKKKFKPNSDLKLMDQVREVLRYYHYAYRTEQTYGDWIKRYLKFHGMKRHPKEMGAAEVETTEIYTHVMDKDIDAVKSPLDLL